MARKAHQRGGGERFQNVVEQALDAAGENRLFALFGVIALHDAHAAERFGEAAGDFGVDFRARAEEGANRLEGFAEAEAEDQQDRDGDAGHAAR